MKILFLVQRTKIHQHRPFIEALNNEDVKTTIVPDSMRMRTPIAFPRFLKLTSSFDPDYVFIDLPYYNAHFIKMLRRRLLIHLIGDFWTELSWRGYLSSSLHEKFFSIWRTKVMSNGIKKASLILPASKWLENRVKNRVPNVKTHVLYKALKKDYWSECRDVNSLRLAHPAVSATMDFEIYPKTLGLIHLMPLMKELQQVHFYLAGGGRYGNLIAKIKPSNVYLLGHVSRSKIKSLLTQTDVFIHPATYESGFGSYSVIEASLLEKPIVASNVGGIPEAVLDNTTGYLCNPYDLKAWKDRIQYLLDNPNVGHDLGAQARRHVENTLNPKRIAKDFIQAISRGS